MDLCAIALCFLCELGAPLFTESFRRRTIQKVYCPAPFLTESGKSPAGLRGAISSGERVTCIINEVNSLIYTVLKSGRSIRMVKLNGEEKELAGKNLLEYLKEAGFKPEQVVVERNLEIVPKEQMGCVTIQDEDVIEVLRFVGGG